MLQPETCIRGAKAKQKPEEYFLTHYYFKYIDTLEEELSRRFGKPQMAAFSLRGLIPYYMDTDLLTEAAATLTRYDAWHKVTDVLELSIEWSVQPEPETICFTIHANCTPFRCLCRETRIW